MSLSCREKQKRLPNPEEDVDRILDYLLLLPVTFILAALAWTAFILWEAFK